MMKSTFRIQGALVALLLVSALMVPGAAAAEYGARAFGMGGAYTGIADDMSSILYNPSRLSDTSFEVGVGLGSNDMTGLTSFYSMLTDPSELSDNTHLQLATLSGISVGSLGLGIAVEGSLDVATNCDTADLCADGEYMSQILLGMGKPAVGLPLQLAGAKIGATLKRLDGHRIEFERTDAGATYQTQTEDWHGQGYSLNLGATVGASEMVTVGVSVSDLISTLNWQGTSTTEVYETVGGDRLSRDTTDLGTEAERLTPIYRAGVAIEPPVLDAIIAVDIASDGTLRYGVEKGLLANAISLRAGQIREQGQTTTTAGLGVNLGPARLDTAFGSCDGFKTVTSTVEGSVRF